MSALVQLLRASPGDPTAIRAAMSEIDGRELVRESARHGLSALARYELKRAEVPLDPASASDLKRDAISIAAGALKVKAVLLRAVDALRRRGMTPVLLKGYGLASRCYPDPLLRPMSDVDLLVSPRSLPEARAALLEVGLHPQDEGSERFSLAHTHHLTFCGSSAPVE